MITFYLIFVDQLDLSLIRKLPADPPDPELPRLHGVADLDHAALLSHRGRLQHLHVQTEEVADSLW